MLKFHNDYNTSILTFEDFITFIFTFVDDLYQQYAPDCVKFEGATYSHNPSKKETYFGYKIHVKTTTSGFIFNYEVTSANVDDRAALPDMLDERDKLQIKAIFLRNLSKV